MIGAGAGHVAADLHASQTDSLTADAITAAAVTKIQNGLALEASSQTILARIGAFTGSGVNTILGFFRALLRSDASITTPSDVGGTFTHTTDSTQAIRDRGDAAWTTGAGGGSTTVNVLPYTGAVPDRVEGTTIKVFYNELTDVSVGVTDASGTAVTIDAKVLEFIVEDRYGADVLVIPDGSITKSGSTFTITIPQTLTDTVDANYRWVKAAVGRHQWDLKHAQKRGYYFDAKLADLACYFFPTCLSFTKGEWAGKPFELSESQLFIVWSLFGWRRADGTRRFRQAYLTAGRKWGKSEFATGLALLLTILDYPCEPAAEVYCAATKEDQAKIVFNVAKEMAKSSEILRTQCKVLSRSILVDPAGYQANSFLKPVGSDSKTSEGRN